MGYGGSENVSIINFGIDKETLNGYFLEAVNAIDGGEFLEQGVLADSIDGGSF